MLNKKAQLTLFIVIGVILVILGVFYVANSDLELFVNSETRLKNQVSDIVLDCLRTSAENGAFLLGYQGGYITIPPDKAVNPNEHIDLGLKIPTWDSQDGDVPTLASMENELQEFIESDAQRCIDSNIQALDSYLVIETPGNLSTDVVINKENIEVDANYPLTFREVNSEDLINLQNFAFALEGVRLGDLYTLAVELYNLEGGTHFLEERVLDQIYSSSDYRSQLSMPSEGMFFSCSPQIWTLPQLKENLANLNNNNFKYLYIEGTRPIDEIYEANLDGENGPEEYQNYFKSHYTFSLSNPKDSYEQYGVEINMPVSQVTQESGIFDRYPYRTFEVTPSSGQIVKPITLDIDAGFKVPIPCIQLYHHLYTLDYDLVVKLTDYSDDAQRYFFQFPLRIEIENNQAKTLAYTPILQEDQVTATNELFCSEESKTYPLRVYVYDTEGRALSDVDIAYKCISLSCDMGQTEKPRFNGVIRQGADPYYEGNFPYCVQGQVIASKEGYHESEIRVDTTSELLNSDSVVYHEIELTPTKTFGLDLSTFLLSDIQTGLGSRVRSVEDGFLYISIENDAHSFETQALWPTDYEEFSKIKLLKADDVEYNVSVLYTDSRYALRGMLEIENWKPEVESGNELRFIIPIKSSEIDTEEYVSFVTLMDSGVKSGKYGVFVR